VAKHAVSVTLGLQPRFYHICLHFYTNSMEHSPWKANCRSAGQEIPAFYGACSFITVFTTARHSSLSWASCIQFTPSHPTSPR